MKTNLRVPRITEEPLELFLSRAHQPRDIPRLLVSLNPGKTAMLLTAIVGLLLAAHLGSIFYFYHSAAGFFPKHAYRLFDLGQDGNVPTLFSAMLLLGAAALLLLIARTCRVRQQHLARSRWLLLCFIFLFLGIDEGAMIHDVLVEGVRNRLPEGAPSVFWIAWVVPYLVFAIAVAVFYARFMVRLPAKTRNLFLLSGLLYIAGAVGFEMIESPEFKAADPAALVLGIKTAKLHVLETIEEVLEMESIVLFIYALLDYLKKSKVSIVLNQAA